MFLRNEAAFGKDGSSSPDLCFFIDPDGFCSQQAYSQQILSPGDIVSELEKSNPTGFVGFVYLQHQASALPDFDSAQLDGLVQAWTLSLSTLLADSSSKLFKEVGVGVVCHTWIQQYLNSIPKPNSQIYVVNCMGHDPKAGSDFGIQGFRELLAEIVYSVFSTMPSCAGLVALRSSFRAVVNARPESACVPLHADSMGSSSGPPSPKPRQEQVGLLHIVMFIRHERDQQRFPYLLVSSLLEFNLLRWPLAAAAGSLKELSGVMFFVQYSRPIFRCSAPFVAHCFVSSRFVGGLVNRYIVWHTLDAPQHIFGVHFGQHLISYIFPVEGITAISIASAI